MILTKLISPDQISALVESLHARQQKIVFTNGCFDLLHAGHVLYLESAKNLGDILIIGLNSDASVKRLKGPERPINPEEERSVVLAALEAVDYVVIFDEDTPLELIKQVRPDVLVKGGDWSVDQIVGADEVFSSGGTVRSIDYKEGLSSTNIIKRIRETESDE